MKRRIAENVAIEGRRQDLNLKCKCYTLICFVNESQTCILIYSKLGLFSNNIPLAHYTNNDKNICNKESEWLKVSSKIPNVPVFKQSQGNIFCYTVVSSKDPSVIQLSFFCFHFERRQILTEDVTFQSELNVSQRTRLFSWEPNDQGYKQFSFLSFSQQRSLKCCFSVKYTFSFSSTCPYV